MANIVVFTDNYPYHTYIEGIFVRPDLEALAREFDKVVVVPLQKVGNVSEIGIPCVEVDTTLAEAAMSKRKLLRLPYLCSGFALSKMLPIIKESPASKIPAGAFYAMNASVGYSLIKKILKKRGLKPEDTLLYTFWFNHLAVSCALLHQKYGYKMIGRAHRYDVYEKLENYRPASLRKMALGAFEHLFTVSKATQVYLQETYPEYKDVIGMRMLGSKKDNDILTQAHAAQDQALTFFSSARATGIKNLFLNLDFVAAMARAYPHLRIKWIHVGDGPLLGSLKEGAKEKMASEKNLTVELLGFQTNDRVHEIYQKEKIDWTMLFSTSEGLGITLVESISYGVPALISNVGGMPEVIDRSNGIVFEPEATVDDMVKAVGQYLASPELYLKLKRNAYESWQARFDSKRLRREFAKEARQLMP